jgi:Tol biopolymer transport system component
VTPLRREAAREQQPSWSPDDKWILFASDRTSGGLLDIWRQSADGTGEPEFLVKGASPSVTPDGTRLIFSTRSPGADNNDIAEMTLDGSQMVRGLVETPFDEEGAKISPDGHWLAYQSNRSGQREVYVSPYPNVETGRWVVSTAAGSDPLWARNSRELLFTAPDGALMGVQVKATGQTWAATAPVKVLDPGYWSREALIGPAIDISPDGKRFLVVTPPRDVADPPDLVVIQHWDQELEARLVKM